jgi:hypothetical protein
LLGINTNEVLEAAATKWNFLKFKPGLVGGHCIGVDPYYLTYKSQQLGYDSQVILAGRAINDGMAGYVAKKVLQSEVKGDFIEHKIAKKAWYPLLSIESEDHENYNKLKENLLLLFKEQPSLYILKNIIIDKCLEYNNNYEIIDSKITSIIVADIFVTYLFNKTLTLDELELLYNGSIEWRKEIAIKGLGNLNIKNNVIELIKNLLKDSLYTLSKTYSDIFSYSVICQPYIISPMINMSDILYYYENILYDFTKNDFKFLDFQNLTRNLNRL